MPFPYTYICDLLQKLEDEFLSSKKEKTPANAIVANWFENHRSRLNSPDNDAGALLSTLLPERRTDRVYSIQVARLHSILGHALGLGHSRVLELRRHMAPGSGVDLGDCVESILKWTPNPVQPNPITVEEVDATLQDIASASRFSSPTVRSSRRNNPDANSASRALGFIYFRLSARDAKWFTRLILKNYQPVVLSEYAVLSSYHVLLPQLLKVRDDLTIATAFLRFVNQDGNGSPDRIASILKPQLGTKVGRQPWFKARSIKHCLDMAKGRNVNVEQKIDGEYCQVHVDLTKGHNCIQIFSKSGKDSTNDRIALHPAIRDSLKLGKSDCPIQQGCILEGELVVYSTKESKILPFHKIRKHVSRSGSFLGTGKDSQPHDHEHLMIIYYDLLMVDNNSLLNQPQSQRRRRLRDLITYREGYAEIVQSQNIACSRRTAAAELREVFAKCILDRTEGIVLKPETPYFDFSTTLRPYTCCNIKLKKEYIQGWGDVGDFAVVGAGYDAARAKTYKIPNLRWTSFYIGCLQNRSQVRSGNEMPRFVVVSIVEISEILMKTFRTHCNPETMPYVGQDRFELKLHGAARARPPMVVFDDPVIFDVRCFSFDKEPNTNFWSMRFPMVSRIHFDRSYMDAITFEELQEMAAAATGVPEMEDSQELRSWIRALEKADPRGIAVDAASQQTTSSEALEAVPLVRESVQEQTRQGSRDIGEELYALTPTLDNSRLAQGGGTLSSPPTSSATRQGLANTQPMARAEVGQSWAPKRWCESENERSPKKRSLPGSEMTIPSASKTDQESTVLPSIQPRQPLSQIDQNAPPAQRSPCETTTAVLVLTSASSAGISNADTHQACEHANVAPRPEAGVTRCSLAGHECALANKSILLSPCIAGYAWVTETLLTMHGITEFLVDPATWTQQQQQQQKRGPWLDSQRSASTSISTSTTTTHKDHHTSSKSRTSLSLSLSRNGTGTGLRRPRKICLVESRRAEATREFLGRVEAAGLRTRGGAGPRCEWIAVYDWRVLEKITDLETLRSRGAPCGGQDEDKSRGKSEGEGGYDPWRHYYVGIT